MKKYLFLLGLFFFQVICLSQEKVNIKEYQLDIKYLKDSLPTKHPNLFFYKSKEQFDSSLDKIATDQNLSSNNALTIQMQLREAIAGIGDPHTNFGFYESIDKEGYFPLEIYWFDDGIWIIGADEKYKSAIGKKLVAINDVTIDEVIKRVSKVVPKNEPYFARKRMHYFLMSHGILKAYEITDKNQVRFVLEDAKGKKETVLVQPKIDEYIVDNFSHLDNPPFFWQSPQSDETILFQQKYFERDSILFIQYNSCWGRELEERFRDKEAAKTMPYFSDFKNKIFETLSNKPVKKILFDLRFNGGGSSPQGTRLVEELAKVKEINQKGKLFVAISEHTFSSAVINAMNFRQMTNAIIVGKPSGGAPNHYGEVRPLVLPKTKLEVYHSTKYFKYIDEDINAVIPDVQIEMKYSDIINGKDQVYEFVKKY
ncbi:S41 family peptidase [Aquimarina algicola]|uniref:Uncharacterized protein n=1 Tax=Aquimarina algicola TaxID=2589995 RepID=A0A504J4Z3_9FLAO|nr:S41 family peptidase [Aquimarina algicola]TPN82978.1 hypothetical protein FHK87_21365 [Aquimarina algicola]